MTVATKELSFDPGFAPYIIVFQGTIEYLYSDINRFKNFSQKKIKFFQYHKKILEIFYNNIGFYTGCLMWASYLKSQPKAKISGNSFFAQKYNETENVADVNYLINFTELFPKDMKYFLGQNFSFDENVLKLLLTYKEFLVLNKGFTVTEFNYDIELPSNVNLKNFEKCHEYINSAIKNGNLNQLFEHISDILL